MKTISPVSIWQNGQNVNAVFLNAYVVNDNLVNSATFYYALLSENQAVLSQGNLTMSGTDYAGFTSNDYAYNWIAAPAQLNLTITGDYVPPVTETITSTPEAPIEAPIEETAPTKPTI